MKKILSLCLILMLCLTAANGVAEGLLGDLDARLEPMEGSDFYFYSQLNNVLANNRIVYDASHIYFAWGNSLYCANYDGGRVWELTDTLADGSPIALQGDRIYCVVNVAGADYFTAIKIDGSELPDKIVSFDELYLNLRSKNITDGPAGKWVSISRIVTSKNSSGNVHFSYFIQGHYNEHSGLTGQTYPHDNYQIGIASYNIGERTFTNVEDYYSKTTKLDSITSFWYQNGIMTYELNIDDLSGIRRYDLAETESNVISNSHLKRVIDMLGRIYFIEKDTGRFYTIAYTGSQKMKLLDGVTEFVITENGLMLYTKNDGLYAADEDALNETLVTNAITGRFYLMGDWVYYYTDDNIQRLSLRDGSVQVVFDPSWV